MDVLTSFLCPQCQARNLVSPRLPDGLIILPADFFRQDEPFCPKMLLLISKLTKFPRFC